MKNVNYFRDKDVIRELFVAFTERAGLCMSKEISIQNFQIIWTPVSTGVTTFYDCIIFATKNIPLIKAEFY